MVRKIMYNKKGKKNCTYKMVKKELNITERWRSKLAEGRCLPDRQIKELDFSFVSLFNFIF